MSTKVVTGLVRLSYANVWKPRSIGEDSPAKYSTAILIPKSDKTTLTKINDAIKAAQVKGKESKWGGKLPKGMKLPLRDGDEEKVDEDGVVDPTYAGHYFLNASSADAPGIVDRNRNQIMDESEVYSGCYCYVSINMFPYSAQGNRGVGAGLNNIMKVKDGESLGGRARAEDDFAEVEIPEDEEDDFLA